MKKVMNMLVGAAAFIAAASLVAQETQLNKAADWKKNQAITDGNGVLNVNGRVFMVSSKRFDIDPAKAYTIKYSVCAPNVQEKKTAKIIGGFMVYDKDGRPVSSSHCKVIPDTLTEIVADAAKGESVLIVKDGSKFKKYSYWVVVADAKPDLSDLPNRNILSTGIKNVEKDGENWKITLGKPLVKDVKAGTSIRLHSAGGHLYTAGIKNVGNDWIVMSGTIKGVRKGVWFGYVWPAGAAKAEIIILSDWNNLKTQVQFKDISLTVK